MTQNSESESENDSEDFIETNDISTLQGSERSTGLSLRSNGTSSPTSEDSGADGLIRLMDSLKPSETSGQGGSNSMSLIDASAAHLFSLMKSVAPKTGETFDPEKIKAVCSTAKEMRELIRLKVDVLREFRK